MALLEHKPRGVDEPEALIEEAREAQRRRYRRWGGGLALLILLVAGGLLLFGGGGSPAAPSGPVGPAPAVIHAPLPSGIVARAADPGGGLPWGTRLVKARGWTCVQVGRLSGDQLGEVGVDNVYHNDGRFHPFNMATNHHTPQCVRDDANGSAFMTVELGTIPTSTVITGWNGNSGVGVGGCDLGTEVARAHQVAKRLKGRAATNLGDWSPPTCPASDERFIEYGLLGPDAKSITYTYNGHHLSEPTGPDGAYLLVGPASPKFCGQFARGTMCGGSGQEPNSLSAGMLTSVNYTNGRTCKVGGVAGGFTRCPEVGYVAPKPASGDSAAVRAPVSVKVVTAKHYCFANGYYRPSMPAPARQITYIPCGGSIPAGAVRDSADQQGSDIIFSFTARKPSTASSRYEYMITWLQSGRPRHLPQGCGGGSGGSVLGRVHQGERLTVGDFVPAQCTGTYAGTVYYDPNTQPGPGGGPAAMRPGQNGAVPIGRFKATVH